MALLQLAKIAFFSKHCHFLSFFCHFSKIFSIFFSLFLRNLHQNDKKMTNFPQNDKKMTNKMTLLQLAKIAFFSKHCHFFVIFLSFFCHFRTIFLKIVKQIEKKLEKWHKNDRKMTKKWQCFEKNAIFATCKSAILFVVFLSFFCHFVENLSFFCRFGASFSKIVKKIEKIFEKWQKNDKKMTMLREKCNFCQLQKCHFVCRFFVIFLPFCGKFVIFFLSFWCKFLKNSEKDRKILRKMAEKWQTKLKWAKKRQKNDKKNDRQKKRQKNDKKMTDKTEMTKKNDKKMTKKWQTKLKWQKKWQTKRQKNYKINIWTISRVWLRVSSKRIGRPARSIRWNRWWNCHLWQKRCARTTSKNNIQKKKHKRIWLVVLTILKNMKVKWEGLCH